jgi:hypothetical protein
MKNLTKQPSTIAVTPIRTPMPAFRLSRIAASSPPKHTGHAIIAILQFSILDL